MLHTATSSGAPVRALLCLLVITLSFACNSGTLAEGGNDPSPQYEAQNVSADSGTSDDCDSGVWCPPPSCGPGVFCPTPDAGVEVTVSVLGARGLYTSPSFLTSAPPGAALQADNLVVDKPGEYTTRRGFERILATIPGDYEISAWTVYQGAVIAHVGEASTLYRYVSGAWTAYSGTYDPPSPGLDADGNPIDGQVKFFETQQALYFTTALGVYRLEGPTETPVLAGAVQALAGVASAASSGQALSTSSVTAYRYVWGRRATNGRLMLGAPSGRVTFTNRSEAFAFNSDGVGSVSKTSGVVTVTVLSGVAVNLVVGQFVTLSTVDPADVADFPEETEVITSVGPTSFTYAQAGADASASNPTDITFTTTATAVDVAHVIPIPSGVDASYFLQVYRADEVPLNVTPSDEMYLVHEEAYTDMPVGATSYTFTDGTPDALKGDALYTNANSGGSIGASHYRPPKAAVATLFGNRAIYANVELPERIELTILAVGTGGLNVGSKIIISNGTTSFTYTGDTTENAGTGHFQVFTDGTPSQNVANTVSSLARVVNGTTSGLVYARDEANPNNALSVGRFVLESRSTASVPLTVRSGRSAPYIVPALGYSVPVSIMSRTANVTTVNTPIPHGFVVGQVVRREPVSGLPFPDPNFPAGTFTVASVLGQTVFTVADVGPNATAGSMQHTFSTTGEDVTTDDEAAPGGWMVSDLANPDSVPAVIPEIVGDRYKRILRTLQVGGTLFFLKDDGLFRLIGNSPENYDTDCVDPTIRFVAPRAAWVLNGRAYALTTQGLTSWTESGTPEPAALQIEDKLRAAVETYPALTEQTAFALSHESKRRAYLWLPDENGFANAVVYVYNGTTDAWTRWTKPAVDAFIHPTEDRLWIAPPDEDGSGTAPPPAHERNAGVNADYRDETGGAIQATLQWTPLVPPETTLQQQVVRVTYQMAGPTPTTLDVAFGSDWVATPLWWTLDSSSSTSPGTMTTVPDQDHSRGNYHSLYVRHAVVNQPLRMLGYSAQARYWTRLIP